MKTIFVESLIDPPLTSPAPKRFMDFFMVTRMSISKTSTGKPYLRATLADRTGSVEARQWDGVTQLPCNVDDFVKVDAEIETYNGEVQLKILQIRPARQGEISEADFFAASKRDRDEMLTELDDIALNVADPWIGALLVRIVSDDSIRPLLREAPAAMKNHHAYRGGLLEHVLGLCALASAVAKPTGTNVDLLIAGAVLHDIGKIRELKFERATQYSVAGNLLGHVLVGFQMVTEAIDKIPGFPEDHRLAILHIIASHHGLPEHGAARKPAMAEAIVFNYMDLIDSRVNMVRTALERCDNEFSEYVPALGVNLWSGPPNGWSVDVPEDPPPPSDPVALLPPPAQESLITDVYPMPS